MINFDDLGILTAIGISHQLLNINYSLSLRVSNFCNKFTV